MLTEALPQTSEEVRIMLLSIFFPGNRRQHHALLTEICEHRIQRLADFTPNQAYAAKTQTFSRGSEGNQVIGPGPAKTQHRVMTGFTNRRQVCRQFEPLVTADERMHLIET